MNDPCIKCNSKTCDGYPCKDRCNYIYWMQKGIYKIKKKIKKHFTNEIPEFIIILIIKEWEKYKEQKNERK